MKRGRETHHSHSSPHRRRSDTHTVILPQILASLANLHTTFAQSLLTKHIHHLHKSLNSKTLTLINNSFFLSLLPSLLRTTNSTPSIPERTAEIIGALALQSFESNQRIALDDQVLRALLEALVSRRKKVSMAACNAILDISTTSIGREQLCKLNALENLMSVFLQDANLPANDFLLCSKGNASSNSPGGGAIDDEFRVLLLDAIVALINTCNMRQLFNIPEGLSKTILSHLKAILDQMRAQASEGHTTRCSKKINTRLTIAKVQDLVEAIFRLSINSCNLTNTPLPGDLRRSIFGKDHSDFEHFMFDHWENSPILLRKPLERVDNHHNLWSSVVQSFNSKKIYDVLSAILKGLVCCPPLASDELDILNFLKETKNRLGHPIRYGQDIRVVKVVEEIHGTNQRSAKREVHYIKDCIGSSSDNGPDLINSGNIQKCEDAYREGYTIALRGMEFRSKNIASVANELALLFGQPSVGVNSYLTPPRSQGLARHYDDHCVFVCQLLGRKQWTVFPRSTLHLPRLYEPLGSVNGSKGDIPESKCQQFLLEEGDILYIPRGCPHEACTSADDQTELDDASTGFSFHLTLGVEIEPPFEWEGFAHVALNCWNQNRKTAVGPFSGTMNFMTHLLHVAIQQLGVIDPSFAKACMVISFSSSLNTHDKHQSNTLWQSQRTTFNYLISRIHRDAQFLEAFKAVEMAVGDKNDYMFHRMRWLKHLYQEREDAEEEFDWDNPLMELEKIFLLFNEHREDGDAAFMQAKSQFCREVVFEDVCDSFVILHHKYKKVRKEYMNGMLSLHCNGNV